MYNLNNLEKCSKQYKITHTTTKEFKVGEIVFLKSNPELPLLIEKLNQKTIYVTWFNDENIKCGYEFIPEIILQYRYNGLLVYNDKFNVCLN